MADFRKWFFAFAVVALLSGLAVPSNAQVNTPALQCVANAGVPPIVRAEGLTELVGDLVLNCTGGTPTLPNNPVPQSNVTIFLNTNVTSRLLGSGFDEALLIIDEPHSPTNPTVPLLACGAPGAPDQVIPPSSAAVNAPGVCVVYGSPQPNPTLPGYVGTYNGALATGGQTAANLSTTTGRPNVYQGRQGAGPNQVTWLGVPIDPPGTNNQRVIRITNVRANANNLGVSSTLVPTQIVEYITVTGSTALPINNPQQTVASIQPGLLSGTSSASFIQCISNNAGLANGSSSAPSGPQDGATIPGGGGLASFIVTFNEGFASSWKVKNLAENYQNGSTTVSQVNPFTYNGGSSYATADLNQNVPGAIYNTESGFLYNSTDPTPNPPGYTGTPIVSSYNFTGGPSRITGAGVASQGTRLAVTFASVPQGTQLWVPTRINLFRPTDPAPRPNSGVVVLTSTDGNGAGGFSPVTPNGSGLAPLTITNGTALAVYEVLYADPYGLERLNIPVWVAYVSNTGNNLPAPGVQATATMGFAPVSNVGVADSSSPIPRFVPGTPARNAFIINKCSCNILFPFVTNQAGFDTGVAIANTSLDPYGTTPQTGTVTLNYYGVTGASGAAPAAQTTNAPVPGGSELIFTLSGGGNYGIAATPGFQGYIIAQTQFQFCHAFAFISDVGAQRVAEGYLGIVLDVPGLNRTGQIGEVQAH